MTHMSTRTTIEKESEKGWKNFRKPGAVSPHHPDTKRFLYSNISSFISFSFIYLLLQIIFYTTWTAPTISHTRVFP